jgi:lipopolysaccharide transport system ATP-binding protein
MSDTVIAVQGLAKRYRLGRAARHDTLRDALSHGFKNLPRLLWRSGRDAADDAREFWALRDVSFTVRRGEALGIIGRNGAGKSTLLKILSRITEPTTGRVTLRGRVASLLEVGTGFHPELSGRENIFLNGAILGMSRAEIRRKFDEIVAFAEVEKFLDTPVKHYSSGMYVRLAFAVAAHLEPEILIVDEVLAVGDVQFQQKCLGKMQDVAATEGRTILFVSHNISAVQSLCSRVLHLDAGHLRFDGAVNDGLESYLQAGAAVSGRALDHLEPPTQAVVRCLDLTVNGRREDHLILPNPSPLEIALTLEAHEAVRVSLETFLCDRYGQKLALCSPGHDESSAHVHSLAAGQRARLVARVVLPRLLRGHYQLEFALVQPFVCRYLHFPAAVELAIEGSGVSWSRLYEQAPVPVGHAIMDGEVRLERLT